VLRPAVAAADDVAACMAVLLAGDEAQWFAMG